MCPRFLFVDTIKSVHRGHHPHSHTWSTHGRIRTLTFDPMCPRFLFVDTIKSVHRGHHPHSHTWSTHGRIRTLTLDKRLDKLDKFHVLQSTSQLECKPMRERGIRWSGRFDLHRRPPGPRPGAQRFLCAP